MKILSTLLLTILMFSCSMNSNKYKELEKMNWLIGNWESKLINGLLIENWKIENDSTYSGLSCFLINKDTVHFEKIKLFVQSNKLIYSSIIEGQNDDNFVVFKFISEKDSVFAFENSSHDYPRKITYKHINDTSFTTQLSGIQTGKQNLEEYIMRKIR